MLLVQHWAISDPDTGSSYTVKEYRSLRVEAPESGDDASWNHTANHLVPRNKDFRTILVTLIRWMSYG